MRRRPRDAVGLDGEEDSAGNGHIFRAFLKLPSQVDCNEPRSDLSEVAKRGLELTFCWSVPRDETPNILEGDLAEVALRLRSGKFSARELRERQVKRARLSALLPLGLIVHPNFCPPSSLDVHLPARILSPLRVCGLRCS